MGGSELEDVLAKLETLLPELKSCWRPGATSKEVAAAKTEVSALPAALERLVAIHNGMASECSPLPRFVGLEIHVAMRGAGDNGLFPFTNDANGAYLCLDGAGRVVEIPHDSDDPLLWAPNLESFFAQIADAIEAGQIGGKSGADYRSVFGGYRRIVFAPSQREAKVGSGHARFWSINGERPIPGKLAFEVRENQQVTKTWTVASQLARPRLNSFTKSVAPPRRDFVPFPKLKPIRVEDATLRLSEKLDFPVWVSLQMLDQVQLWDSTLI